MWAMTNSIPYSQYSGIGLIIGTLCEGQESCSAWCFCMCVGCGYISTENVEQPFNTQNECFTGHCLAPSSRSLSWTTGKRASAGQDYSRECVYVWILNRFAFLQAPCNWYRLNLAGHAFNFELESLTILIWRRLWGCFSSFSNCHSTRAVRRGRRTPNTAPPMQKGATLGGKLPPFTCKISWLQICAICFDADSPWKETCV